MSPEACRGKHYPAYIAKPAEGQHTYSVCFAQFSFGIGSGDTEREAVEHAEYVLAYGVSLMASVPDLVSHEEAVQLVREELDEIGISASDVSWTEIEVKLEVLEEEEVLEVARGA
ncbi:hypothetical protein HYH03_014606 [Edaphochlamys debaryana]|uniref:Uncharacterized protein n=1 Tax=Edaphochlamys debaryana TaxID=47281 RepID=A0A835XNE8_9CHLO|nr:hypothetical protein HYH03_014606 [Edaphochlamys debaryana]|eukprot:KAG2486675.1 hypothetical protein HYH03_014606 [Edaphochlamys debaryana]